MAVNANTVTTNKTAAAKAPSTSTTLTPEQRAARREALAKRETAARTADDAAMQKTLADQVAKQEPTDDLPPSGSREGEGETVTVQTNGMDPLTDVETQGDPTGLTEPTQFGSSADPIAEVDMPKTVVTETQAGVEIRPETEPPSLVMATSEDALAKTYGVHSGRVGNVVPVVDDYVVNNPRAGGLIGGETGPGAVGRVKAEQDAALAARKLVNSLTMGADAAERLERENARADDAGKTAYKVVGGAIHTADGKKVPGQKVMLTKEEARHFDAIERLGPWID